jgi:hypothetical protein
MAHLTLKSGTQMHDRSPRGIAETVRRYWEAIRIFARDQPLSLAHTALDAALVTPREAMAPKVLGRLGVLWC